jgi:hypothetical protein
VLVKPSFLSSSATFIAPPPFRRHQVGRAGARRKERRAATRFD